MLGRREHPAHLEQPDFFEKDRLHATKSSLAKDLGPSFTARDANQRINWAVESYGDIVGADPVVAQLHPFDPWLGLRGLDLIAQLGLLTAHAACLVMVTSAPLVQE